MHVCPGHASHRRAVLLLPGTQARARRDEFIISQRLPLNIRPLAALDSSSSSGRQHASTTGATAGPTSTQYCSPSPATDTGAESRQRATGPVAAVQRRRAAPRHALRLAERPEPCVAAASASVS